MNNANTRVSILHIAIGTLVLAIVLRTWFVMGLIEPLSVAGSSMVPTLRGPHLAITCATCGQLFEVGAEFETDRAECPHCGTAIDSVDDIRMKSADHLLVDRTAYEFRLPRRWELVVFRSPEDGQLTVKRVIGLPGECLELRAGDLWIDGRIATKNLYDSRAMRQLVHIESELNQRWRSEIKGDWICLDGTWQTTARNVADWNWIEYHDSNNRPITTDLAYNAGFTQRLFPARDLALSASFMSTDQISIAFHIAGYDPVVCRGISASNSLLEVFAFDRRVRVFVDGQEVKVSRLDLADPPPESDSPCAIGVQGAGAMLRDLRIDRDIYYASLNEQRGVEKPMTPVLLETDQIFVLGDNVPVSIDSRHWGPVPVRLLVGKPVGIH